MDELWLLGPVIAMMGGLLVGLVAWSVPMHRRQSRQEEEIKNIKKLIVALGKVTPDDGKVQVLDRYLDSFADQD